LLGKERQINGSLFEKTELSKVKILLREKEGFVRESNLYAPNPFHTLSIFMTLGL